MSADTHEIVAEWDFGESGCASGYGVGFSTSATYARSALNWLQLLSYDDVTLFTEPDREVFDVDSAEKAAKGEVLLENSSSLTVSIVGIIELIRMLCEAIVL